MPDPRRHPYRSHFRRRDPVLHDVIGQVGPCQLKPNRDRFGMLVRSIISQQISTSAARSIREKLERVAGPLGTTPETIRGLSVEQLRAAGLSTQKTTYLRDLAEKVTDGSVRLRTIGRRTDEEIVEELTQVKGIGRWTAQMFLIFALNREDVFPIDDFGVRSAMQSLYELPENASRAAFLEIGARWSPYASIGSWYCWRYLDLQRGQKNTP